MPFHWCLQAVVLNSVLSVVYVQCNKTTSSYGCSRPIIKPTKLLYKDTEIDEDKAAKTWNEILSNPLTDDGEFLKGIKQGKPLLSFHLTVTTKYQQYM